MTLLLILLGTTPAKSPAESSYEFFLARGQSMSHQKACHTSRDIALSHWGHTMAMRREWTFAAAAAATVKVFRFCWRTRWTPSFHEKSFGASLWWCPDSFEACRWLTYTVFNNSLTARPASQICRFFEKGLKGVILGQTSWQWTAQGYKL